MTLGYIHCIGIGGIGVSALARLYHSRGWRVSGSDLARSEITDALAKEGIRVFIGPHRKRNVAPSVTKVIYTAAATPQLLYSFHDRGKRTTKKSKWRNPEIQEARGRRIAVMSYAEAVGELSREFKTIAIAGSHGKSTTTAMIALMMARAGLDPTVMVGTKLREFGNTNFRLGRSHYLVFEADEYRGSFWNYRPWIAVVTNIDREHLDFYRNVPRIEAAFLKFLLGIAPGGAAILNGEDQRLRRVGRKLKRARPDIKLVWYSLRNPAAGHIKRILRIPGRHNVANALAAYRVGHILGIPRREILRALARYRGSWRRFDYQGMLTLRGASGQAGAKVFADYAHHPTEIKATLQAAREKFPRNRIWCVFQPHHYERMRDLFREFSRAFSDCDALVLLDIYEVAGRERKRKYNTVSSATLAAAINRRGTPALYLPHSERRLKPFLKTWLQPGDVLLMMGAGDIWNLTKALMRSK